MTAHRTPSHPADDGGPRDATAPADPMVRRVEDAQELVEKATAVLIGTLARVQGLGRVPSVVLTGGTIARRLHRTVRDSPDRDLVDWSRVDIWFGDERYVPQDDAERNAGQAAEDMLDALPVDPGRLHVMPASDAGHPSVEAAAAAYAAELTGWAPAEGPWFDVLMLGVGPDAHCASLFPGHPGVDSPEPVLAVHDSPKPPPTRISLGMSTLQRAREVWFVVSGAEKAEAVVAGVRGADVHTAPCAGPRGQERTIWYVDREAAWML